MSTELERDMAERFKRDTAEHVMTVLHDDGLYRHLRFAQPDRSGYWFEIVTWPGSLAVRGDIDGRPIFSRLDDMFAFFRSDSGRIHPQYWAEKTDGAGQSLKEYTEDVLLDYLEDDLGEYEGEVYPDLLAAYDEAKAKFDELPPELQRWKYSEKPVEPLSPDDIRKRAQGCANEEEARDLLAELENAGICSGTWEWDLRGWTWSFLWICHAIVSGIAQYDAAKTGGVA